MWPAWPRAEWRVFYEAYWHEQIAERRRHLREIADAWDAALAPTLAPFLRERQLNDGIFVVSPAIGFEGRVYSESAGGPVLAAAHVLGAPSQVQFSALLLVRELCFLSMPRTSRALQGSDEERETARRNLAVRCGEILLEHYAPAALAAYRQLFAFPRGGDDPSPGVLAELYPVNSDVLVVLTAERS